MRVIRAESLTDALASMATADGRLTPIAGATDLFVSWPERIEEDLQFLDLSGVRQELGALDLTEDRLRLGSLSTYWDVITSEGIGAAFPLLVQAARSVGAVQIQTRGTWAGNIENGSPAADGVLVLMVYDAEVVLASQAGQRSVPLEQYFTGYRESVRRPDELIVAIDLPRRSRRREWFHVVGARRAQAITKVGVAVVHDDLGWRVTANSVAPVVCRCRALEHALEAGRTFHDPCLIEQVLSQDISPIDDIRSTAAYRSKVLSRLLYYWLADGS